VNSEERIQHILGYLRSVDRERERRARDPLLAERAQAVRAFQADRLRKTHAALLADPQTRPAARFFLDELYGAQDFFERDRQVQRIVPTLVRLFSADVAETVALMVELHALSEQLDTRMAECLAPGTVSDEHYARAWRQVGEPALRDRQIDCVKLVGHRLIRYTTHPSLGRALRLMRLPAKAAGLQDLQAFLERGFEAFGGLSDPKGFLQTVQERERRLALALFDP
jgi:hypothetical protein